MDDRPLPETCCPDRGTLWLWPGHAIYFGPSFNLDAHSGAVHCFALGVDAPFELRSASIGTRKVRSAFIPARTRHQIIATGRMLFSYSDSTDVRSEMTDNTSSIAFTHRAETALLANPLTAHEHLCRNTEIDERIREATLKLQADPARAVSAAALAAEANLSVSRFLHLFSANTGTSFRRYRLWTRMIKAGELITQGANFTSAALAAGFASANHFSETFHTMFGLTPTTLLTTGTKIILTTQKPRQSPGQEEDL